MTGPSTTTELAVKIRVEVGNGEPIESALRRFKKEVNKSSHLMELRHRRYFENSQDKIKRKRRRRRGCVVNSNVCRESDAAV
jgi:small subunit ribosomal protein S21